MTPPSALLDLGIREVGAGYRASSWSPQDVTAAALDRIAATEPIVHSWVLIDPERAMAAASVAEAELKAGIDRGPLHGMPIGIKDIFDVQGWPTRCGSAALRNASPAQRDAGAIAALRQAGAVILGKTVTQEFAAGVVSAPARNPWHPERIPGGSSGGSAVAVALHSCYGAMGSDTGGSIRIPASACGVVGFKPAYGQLDVSGVFPLAWSLDTVGPLARTVDDAWLLWRSLQGDNGAIDKRPFAKDGDLTKVRIGVPRPFFFDNLQTDVLDVVAAAIVALKNLGATIVEAPWPLASAARAAAFVINRVETASVHERVAVAEPDRFVLYGDDLRLRVAAGRAIPATLYVKALRVRQAVFDSIRELYREHELDALIAPTLPTTAVRADTLAIEGTGLDESIGAGWTRLTMPFNATGQPVLALPCGHDRDGLPVGLQLAGEPGEEEGLFHIGHLLERELGQSRMRPPLLQADIDGSRMMAE